MRHAIARLILFVLIALIDPFGLLHAADEHSHAIWQRAYAADYRFDDRSDATGTAKPVEGGISVVYLDKAAIAKMAHNHPLNSFDISDVIDTIMTAARPGSRSGRPKAVFVDLLLGDAASKADTVATLLDGLRRGDPGEKCDGRRYADGAPIVPQFACLLRTVANYTRYAAWKDQAACQINLRIKLHCIEEAGGTPILFAIANDPRTLDHPDRAPEAPTDTTLATLDIVAGTVLAGVDHRAYPLVVPQTAWRRSRGVFQLYPAAALYRIYCYARCARGDPFQDASLNDDLRNWRKSHFAWPRTLDRPVEVIWAQGSPSDTRGAIETVSSNVVPCLPASGSDDAAAQPSLPLRLARDLRRLAGAAFLSRMASDERPLCLYFDSVPFGTLGDLHQDSIDALLGGKIVLLGADLPDSNDVVPAGPFGAVPGVYYHAMALDNLIARGADYPKGPTQLPYLGGITDLDLESVGIAFVMVFIGGLVLSLFKQRRQAGLRRDLLAAGGGLIAMLAGMAATVFLVTGQLRLLPRDFNLAALSLVALAEVVTVLLVLLRPLRAWLAAHNAAFAFLFAKDLEEEHPTPASQPHG